MPSALSRTPPLVSFSDGWLIGWLVVTGEAARSSVLKSVTACHTEVLPDFLLRVKEGKVNVK
jgi:hypothetical protein